MKRALARMTLVATSTLALYLLALAVVALLPGVDLVQPAPLGWVGVFLCAAVFAAWNLADAVLDARVNFQKYGWGRMLAGSFWHVRSHALQGAGCTAWAGAGALAVLQWGTLELRTACYVAGALCFAGNQVWNRLDRERIVLMPRPAADADAMTRLAEQLAADARLMGHDVRSGLQIPVTTLEILRARPGMTATEIEEIDAALEALFNLGAHIQRLHAHARSLDPSLRDQG